MTASAARAQAGVVGAGPAGLALATALAERAVSTVLVAPDPEAPWVQTLAGWTDELGDVPLSVQVGAVEVVGDRRRVVARPYGVIDNEALQRDLLARFERAGGTVHTGSAVGACPDGERVAVLTASGSVIISDVVFDASGRRPAIADATVASAPLVQRAYGVVAAATVPGERGRVILMDASGSPGDRCATFLYAIDLGGGRWLLEETSLAARPPMPFEDLERRLHERLARMGAVLGSVEHVEQVHIEMSGPTADRRSLPIAFGAAAGYVHPATGYSVGRSLRAAPAVASAVSHAFGRRATPAAVRAAARAAVWPSGPRRARRLLELGGERVAAMDAATFRSFLDGFFALPAEQRDAYLSGSAAPSEVAAAMRTLYRGAPPRLRRALSLGR